MEQKSLIMEARLQACAPAFAETLAGLKDYTASFAAIGTDGGDDLARWDQDWFARLDAAMAYAMVAHWRPRRILEVGAGHSTRFMARAIVDAGLDCQITAIDPAPRAALPAGVGWQAQTLQTVGAAPFLQLCSGDVAFFDSSHIVRPGSDAAFIFEHVLPGLAPGVLVHFHDIFLPDGYPAHWAWRGYNEQDAVAALLEGQNYDILFASHYVTAHMAGLLAQSAIAGLPFIDGAIESSLWLRKRE